MALFGGLFGKKGSSFDKIRDAATGEEVQFGVFPQDKKGKNRSPITWLVLDKKEGRVLLLSKYLLFCKEFNTEMTTWNGIIGWEKSTLRAWLNSAFIEGFFTPEEQAAMAETDVTADPNPDHDINPGAATEDRVFLLSVLEAEKYLPSDQERACKFTEFAKACGAWTVSPDMPSHGQGRWWLRTPGYNQNRISVVEVGGNLLTGGNEIQDNQICVRPAIWVKV